VGDILKISVKQGVGDLPAPFLLAMAALWRQRIVRGWQATDLNADRAAGRLQI